jgi:hypothetical protein
MFVELMDNSKNEIFQTYFDKEYSFPLEITKQNVKCWDLNMEHLAL